MQLGSRQRVQIENAVKKAWMDGYKVGHHNGRRKALDDMETKIDILRKGNGFKEKLEGTDGTLEKLFLQIDKPLTQKVKK
jgi:hypothetical protein